MKATVNKMVNKIKGKVATVAPSALAVSVMMANSLVMADSTSDLFEVIVGLVSGLVVIAGAVLGLFGIIHYASANSEGDGPAKAKAMNQITAAIMLVGLSIGLSTFKSSLSTIISNAFSS